MERLAAASCRWGRAVNRAAMIREMILQMKTGEAERLLQGKFGEDILNSFAEPFRRLEELGQLHVREDGVELTRPGLLQVDRFLPEFFEAQHRGARYT